MNPRNEQHPLGFPFQNNTVLNTHKRFGVPLKLIHGESSQVFPFEKGMLRFAPGSLWASLGFPFRFSRQPRDAAGPGTEAMTP